MSDPTIAPGTTTSMPHRQLGEAAQRADQEFTDRAAVADEHDAMRHAAVRPRLPAVTGRAGASAWLTVLA
ncbi:hypothetical protein [Amycolatopsis sp. lyj-23]|uniref:hypothetical protein n=1 Tax=Amycolatopsis sp. lyj-23 TaxID=2789283 RepID=UPI00397D708C